MVAPRWRRAPGVRWGWAQVALGWVDRYLRPRASSASRLAARHLRLRWFTHSAQSPVSTRLSTTCPRLQGFPVKYRVKPFARASLRVIILGMIASSVDDDGGASG